MSAKVECCGTKFSLYVLVIIGLVGFAGLMAGLTLGLMSLGLVDLEVLIKSGRPQDRIHACIFYFLINSHASIFSFLKTINGFLSFFFFFSLFFLAYP